MKIAQIAPIIERVPPKKYGGTERVVYALTEELAAKGHDVTLFATQDSITSAKLVSACEKGARELCKGNYYERSLQTLAHIGVAYSMQKEFDIIHDHCGISSLPLAINSTTPVIMTVHGAFNRNVSPVYIRLRNNVNPYFVSISNSQRKSLPILNYIGTVYNGLDMKEYPFSATGEGYLLFVGRITEEKGVGEAIKVALKLKLPLIIAAKLEKKDHYYYKKHVKPYLSNSIRWIGEVTETQRNKLMSRALCFLHPITWMEPFGLTLIEAMACGCPVIALNQGSTPEIVINGITGYAANDIYEMVRAVKKVNLINRKYCRQYALNNFSSQQMTSNYEILYKRILFNGLGKLIHEDKSYPRSSLAYI